MPKVSLSMVTFKKSFFHLLLISLLFISGNALAAKANYRIVDSCLEFSSGPNRHQGLCECYGDPYYYCAYFPNLSSARNKNIVEFSFPFAMDRNHKSKGEYRVIYIDR